MLQRGLLEVPTRTKALEAVALFLILPLADPLTTAQPMARLGMKLFPLQLSLAFPRPVRTLVLRRKEVLVVPRFTEDGLTLTGRKHIVFMASGLVLRLRLLVALDGLIGILLKLVLELEEELEEEELEDREEELVPALDVEPAEL